MVKAHVIRALIGTGPLRGRSRSSVEKKFQNISAVMKRHGIRWVTGYAPLPNVLKSLERHVERRLGQTLKADMAPTADREELERRTSRLRARGPVSRPLGTVDPLRVAVARQLTFIRDPLVHAYVLQAARGRCELCERRAPFKKADGQPYLEVHHVRTLVLGGSDRPENTVALCPTCHRRLHHGADATALRAQLYLQVGRLIEE
ncbi:MAG: HNH endonuclease [Hyalangium sp.]|uniref:HNH endonuclease n=1 Tax=Hyalangium sp. TaxID=2028555 RepID=UPI003899B651